MNSINAIEEVNNTRETIINNILNIIGKIFFVLAIYLYFIGWVYSYFLFKDFGISLHLINIPIYYFFVYSYSVIFNHILYFIIILIIILTLAYLLIISFKRLNKISLLFAIVLCVSTFYPFYLLAKKEASTQALYLREGHANIISFTFKKEISASFKKDLLDANNQDRLCLIIQTKDEFYVLYQAKGIQNELPQGFIYIIPTNDVLYAKIELNEKKEQR